MGLTHHVPDGALLDFAGALDSTKPLHRVTAWVMLGGLRPAGGSSTCCGSCVDRVCRG